MNTFQSIILRWYKKNKRDLPWRKTTDFYAILVSEMMLQQTQVERVIPYYQHWLKKFPTPTALANASTSEVLAHWSGLGYNRRAIFLKNAATYLTQHPVPKTIEDLQQIPGVGPYTAHALAAFSWNKGVTATDTNIRRIFSRYYFKGSGSINLINKKIILDTPKTGREWNNALMDFGSLVCTANTPKCVSCPLNRTCTAYKTKSIGYTRIAPPQSTFIGSRRQYRGLIIKLLLQKLMSKKELKQQLIQQLGPADFIDAVIEDLISEEMIMVYKGKYSINT